MRKLNKLYFLKIEINELKEEIENLTELSSAQITGMPHGTKTSNPPEQYFFKKQKLKENLNKKLENYINELEKIENTIDKIEDEDVRVIARMRFIKNLKWDEISRKVNFDRSVCYRKLDKYLKQMNEKELS